MVERRTRHAAQSATTRPPLVTLDLFSALLDSKTGGGRYFDGLARGRGWRVPGEHIYSAWDSLNKDLQRTCDSWVPFRQLSTKALEIAYRNLHLNGEAETDASGLLASVGDWPTWEDVPAGLADLTPHATVGVLSNVDDDIFARTRVAGLIDDANVLTSQRLRSYKPAPEIYHAAAARASGRYIHVATSARDVHGALSAKINTIRLRRPGHHIHASPPVLEVSAMTEIAEALPQFH